MTSLSCLEPIEWTYERDEASGRYVGHCESLHITLDCDSMQELFATIPDSIQTLLKSFNAHGDLERVGVAEGWPPDFFDTIRTLANQVATKSEFTPRLLLKVV